MRTQPKLKKQNQKKKLIRIFASGVIATLLFALFPIIPQVEAGYAEVMIDDNFDGASSVHVADLDGDEDLDIVGAADAAGKIAWWTNDGFGNFGSKSDIADFAGVKSIYSADVDGDGDKDILGASDYLDEIAWWENPSWTKHSIDASFQNAHSVYAIDLDGDGELDVLGARQTATFGKIAWWKNEGSGDFGTVQEIDNFTLATSVFATDIDNDGDEDILGGNMSEVAWWQNDGSGSFGSKQQIAALAQQTAYSIYAEDFNDDGKIDILASTGGGGDRKAIGLWENIGTWESPIWDIHSVDDTFKGTKSVYSKDIDGDGDMDILGASDSANVIAWWENTDGLGSSWQKHLVKENFAGAGSVYAEDIDSDGYLDVVGAGWVDDDVIWWELEKEDLGAGGLGMRGVAVGDGDNDTYMEVYGANVDGHAYQFKWNGTSWAKTDMGYSGELYDIAIGDGDNDTNNEIYGAIYQRIYQFKLNGSWGVINIGAFGYNMYGVAVGDGNHDGKIEVYGANADGHIYQYRCTSGCNSESDWTKGSIGEASGGELDAMFSVAVGDADGDEDAEVYGASRDNHLYRFRYDSGSSSWIKTDLGSGGNFMYGVAVGDGDNIAGNEVYGGNYDNHIYQFKCTGDAAYCDESAHWDKTDMGVAGGRIYKVTVGDGDNDGNNEIYGACGDNYVYQFKYVSGSWEINDLLSGGHRMDDVAVGEGKNDDQNQIYGANQDFHIYAFIPALKYKVKQLAGHLNAVLTDRENINTEEKGQRGANYLKLKKGQTTISDFRLNFLQDYNWSDVSADVSGYKAFAHIPAGHNEVTKPFTLYVPKGNHPKVRLCVGAQSLNEIYDGCIVEANVTSEYLFENGAGEDPTHKGGAVLDPLPQLATSGDKWLITRVNGSGAQGEGGEEDEAVPEFTTVTLIIAAVAGFAIYLLIRRKNSPKKPKEA